MATLYTLLHLSLKSEMAYAGSFIWYALFSFINYIFMFIFISSIFLFTDDIAGWTEDEMKYIFYTSVLVGLLTQAFAASVFDFFKLVSQGKIEPYLVMPIKRLQLLFFRWSELSIFLSIALVIVLFVFYTVHFTKAELYLDVLHTAGYVTGVLVAVLVNMFFIASLSCLTFLTQREVPVDYIHEDIYRLAILPASLFPNNSLIPILVVIPVVISASAPATILVKGDFELFYFLILAMLTSATFFKITYSKLIQNFDLLGG